MQRVAQDWLVLTQLTHHDASALGVVMGLQFAPQLLLLPWTGIAADRLNQRKLLIATQAGMGVFALLLAALTLAGVIQLWHVYLLAFLSGCAAAFDAPLRQTLVAEVVGDGDLSNAVALKSTSFSAAQMIGPAAAGLIIAKVGIGWAFLLNGLSFGAVLLSMAAFRISELRTSARARRARAGFLEGFCYVWRRPDLRVVLLMLFLIGTFGLNFPIFISTMAVNVFHSDARAFGLLSSFMAIGTLGEALFAATQSRPRLASLVTGAGVFAVGCLLAALAPGYRGFAGALALSGAASVTFTNGTNSLMQLSTEPAMRGRVCPMLSEDLAYSASTGAFVIRSIFPQLNDAGMTRSKLGAGGGALLNKSSEWSWDSSSLYISPLHGLPPEGRVAPAPHRYRMFRESIMIVESRGVCVEI